MKMSRVSLLAAVLGSLLFLGRGEFPFRNTSLPFDERVQVRSEQGVVTPIVRVGPFATGVKMQSRGQAGFLALVKRSRGLSGSVNGQDQLSPKPIPTRTLIQQATLFISVG